jgi:hypothetical protein
MINIEKKYPSSMGSGKERILSFEGGSSRSHYVESWLWKVLWICRKTDC